jgi:hypothetical protein
MYQQTETIEFHGHELTVTGYYEKSEPQTYSYPGCFSSFQATKIEYMGYDITEIIEALKGMDVIEDLVLIHIEQ